MRLRHHFLFAVFAMTTSLAHADRLIGVQRNELLTIDRQTGELSNIVEIDPQFVSFPSQAVAHAYHPAQGLHYFNVSGSYVQQLTVFDSNTGLTSAACTIDVLAEHGSSIEFGAMSDGYPLYLVGGGSNPDPGAIYVVDITTGDAVDTGWATAGGGGHAIAFNSDDGYLYHFYNTDEAGGGVPGLERIDTDTGVVTQVPLSGTVHGVCNGVAYMDGLFYVFEKNAQELFTISLEESPMGSPEADVSLVGTLPDKVQSLASDGATLFTAGPDSSLKGIDTTLLSYSSSVAITNGRPITRGSRMEALARDPTTGILHLVAGRNFPGDTGLKSLYQLDPLTGKLSNEVYLSIDELSGFTFLPDGTLYAASEATAPGPDELAVGTLATVNLSDGTVTALPWPTTLTTSAGGVALAYNNDDGRIYRFYRDWIEDEDELLLDAIDPSTGNPALPSIISGVDLSAGSNVPWDMTYDSSEGLFYLTAQYTGVYAVTPQAEATQVVGEPPLRAFGLEIEPNLELNISGQNGLPVLSFESVANREYGLYSTADLVNWELVEGFECLQATPPVNTVSGFPLPANERGFFGLGAPAEK